MFKRRSRSLSFSAIISTLTDKRYSFSPGKRISTAQRYSEKRNIKVSGEGRRPPRAVNARRAGGERLTRAERAGSAGGATERAARLSAAATAARERLSPGRPGHVGSRRARSRPTCTCTLPVTRRPPCSLQCPMHAHYLHYCSVSTLPATIYPTQNMETSKTGHWNGETAFYKMNKHIYDLTDTRLSFSRISWGEVIIQWHP